MHEGEKIVPVPLVVENLADSCCGLEIGRSLLFNEDDVLDVQMPGRAREVVGLVVHEDQD